MFKNTSSDAIANRPVKFVGVNGYNGSVDRNNASVELQAVLDIELVIGINPGVKEVLVYEDGTDPFAVALIDALDKVASIIKRRSSAFLTDLTKSRKATPSSRLKTRRSLSWPPKASRF